MSEQTAVVEKKQLTIFDLNNGYIELPNAIFERSLKAMEFGLLVLARLNGEGLRSELTDNSVRMLGFVFCGGFTPVEIAVYGYLCYNPAATLREIAKKRRLTVGIVQKAIVALADIGLIEISEADVVKLASLEDLNGPSNLEQVSAIVASQSEQAVGMDVAVSTLVEESEAKKD
jgi:predicted transcriptional regulator